MKTYEATEQAYKNGYEAGMREQKKKTFEIDLDAAGILAQQLTDERPTGCLTSAKRWRRLAWLMLEASTTIRHLSRGLLMMAQRIKELEEKT